jgi:hypothetical protein
MPSKSLYPSAQRLPLPLSCPLLMRLLPLLSATMLLRFEQTGGQSGMTPETNLQLKPWVRISYKVIKFLTRLAVWGRHGWG